MQNHEERIDVYSEDIGADANGPLRHNFNSFIGAARGNLDYFTQPSQWRKLVDSFVPPIKQLKQNIMWGRYKEVPPITLENLDELISKLDAINPENKMSTKQEIDDLFKFFNDTFGQKGFYHE